MNRALGGTGLEVAPVAFGAFKIGRNQNTKYDQDYALPSEEEVATLLNEILNLGINLLDTAPAYGLSESRIGTHLESRRHEYLLSSKVGETFEQGESTYAFHADAIHASLDRSLHCLRSTYLDIAFVHSDGKDLDIIQETDTLEILQRRREKGDLRCVGFSGKTVQGHLAAIDSGLVDVVMVEYNVLNDSQRPVLDAAEEANVGVLVKKGLGSGRITPEEAIPFCLTHPAVASVVIGSLRSEHLATNLEIARRVLS